MPELPEVNTFQKYFDETSLQQKIQQVEVSDAYIIRNLDETSFVEKMSGRTFTGSYRRGKYLFASLDNKHYLQLHFGMTGDLKYYQDEADRPKYQRFGFTFDNGYRLGFDCPRKFARIVYIEDLDTYLQEQRLGPDALHEIDEHQFMETAQGKTGTIKGFLLNQKYMAGVGNLYADEVCYQTQVHPASVVEKIPEEKLRAIFKAMKEVLQYAVDRDAYYKAYPEDWLWKWRDETKQAPDGSAIERDKIGGRTTYYSPKWQKLYR